MAAPSWAAAAQEDAALTPLEHAALFLRAIHEPGTWYEVRALKCPERPGARYKGTATAYHDDPDAAGVGITLTAASRALFVEIDWVPANLTQAEDRCHRKGQKDAVLVEHLVVPGGIDERICRAIIKKQAILDKVMGASE